MKNHFFESVHAASGPRDLPYLSSYSRISVGGRQPREQRRATLAREERRGSVARARSPSSFLAHPGIAIKRFSRCPGIAERSARARPTDRNAASEFFAGKRSYYARAKEERSAICLFGAEDETRREFRDDEPRQTSRGCADERIKHAGRPAFGGRSTSVIVSDLNET